MHVLADTHQSSKITRMIVEGDKESNKVVSLWLENQPTNGQCPADGRWVIDFATDGMAKEKYSQLLSAAVAK